jgi:hypothetical protein
LYGVILTPFTLFSTNLAATSAFDLPTSLCLKRNWRFRFETSMVSAKRSQLSSTEAAEILPTHIYDMDVLEPRKSKILQDFATKTTSASARESVLIFIMLQADNQHYSRYIALAAVLPHNLVVAYSNFIFDIRSTTSFAS